MSASRSSTPYRSSVGARRCSATGPSGGRFDVDLRLQGQRGRVADQLGELELRRAMLTPWSPRRRAAYRARRSGPRRCRASTLNASARSGPLKRTKPRSGDSKTLAAGMRRSDSSSGSIGSSAISRSSAIVAHVGRAVAERGARVVARVVRETRLGEHAQRRGVERVGGLLDGDRMVVGARQRRRASGSRARRARRRRR